MNAAIEVQDLHYRYPDGTPALNGISFTVAEGECVGLIGPNGAGKSTLLLHLNGILGGDAVKIFGETDLLQRRQAVGLLFQDPDDQLFCATVAEDVAFGPQQLMCSGASAKRRPFPDLEQPAAHEPSPRDAVLREAAATPSIEMVVTEALAQVGLTGFEKRSPHHLSHGEKRRACLAGILACQPRVLVLDEPTSDLDPRGRRELKALLQRIPVTKVIATHDLELVAEICSRVFVLDGGQIAAQGLAHEVLNNEALMLAHGLEKPHVLRHLHPHA
jgi:energy-coupling factor transporter ATP-binding protein EcfA2